jgi:hypothetical protein
MFEVDWKTPHLWRKTAAKRTAAPALTGEERVDVLIVGGGFTGLAAALGARDSGVEVALLEGNEIGSAASGRNNGLVISHHSKASPSEFEAAYGKVYGERYNRLVGQSADVAFGLMQRFGIDAHQVQEGWLQPAHTEATLARARRFHEEWKALGAGVTWLDRAEISQKIGSPYLGGWMVNNSGHINPFAMTVGLAGALEREGARIFENSRATRLERGRLAGPYGAWAHHGARGGSGDQCADRGHLAGPQADAHSLQGLPGGDRTAFRGAAGADPRRRSRRLRHAQRLALFPLRPRQPARERRHAHVLA